MIIYNVTSHVAAPIHEAWLQWMKEKHIPLVMQTGCFYQYQWVKVLETDESEGYTYAIQYYAREMRDFEQYRQHHAPQLGKDIAETWGDKITNFRSLMQVVH
ncbi:MAG: DUF4286 family protein [Hydrotalea flava]|uniref:DUF4286 family protein n=1 Tax=Hydrotalea TaxID=1004300 RepID=UPI0016917D49|nr:MULTISPECIES: DUF4286 family protein [Hydrotalea]NIM34818.1 DUF4286 family protein [Hydrotalea flava]NIM37643.1 DUF4286 family protein [Hydrotalea flava]NIN02814.1 DUF4286 family protein [Hydrotalea flava]NIN14499.1 DUF4286 family protein [Hydrotalea flava]NIO93569.1 DUF4286 family protein [Hydrotalea flava]